MIVSHSGFHWYDLIVCSWFLFGFVLPWVIAVTWVRADANRHGQPGWLWVVAALPLGWLAVLAYLIVRAFSSAPRAPRTP